MKRVFSFVKLLLLSAFLTGCAGANRPFYPIGIYGVPSTNDFQTIKSAGFNAVAGRAEAGYLDDAERSRLKVLATPGNQAGSQFNRQAARQIIAQYDSHPALWAWYVSDEPDLNLVSPQDVAAAVRFCKSAGARKPTALVLYRGADAIDYGSISDILMIDCYPIPWHPLASFPQNVGMAGLSAGKNKPLIAVIQAFDWSAYPGLLPGETGLRPPTRGEIRAMTYCALAKRATGLFYYAFKDGTWDMEKQPQTWDALRDVVREVNARLPLFEAKHLWWPREQKFHETTNSENAAVSATGSPAGQGETGSGFKGWNEAMESSVNVALLRVVHGNQTIAAGRYLLAVNNTRRTFEYQVTVPAANKNEIEVLGEDRQVSPDNGWLTDDFGPYEVHIYGPF